MSIAETITAKKTAFSFFAVFIILLYSAISIVLLLHHEPWEDEAHTWLVARDLNIISIFKQMAYDGTPALWYMLLVPFAKAGFPYISEAILHLTIAISAVTVFVLYAPFSKVTKVLFIFSYYMAYEYSIIARSYCLSILLLFLIATLYGKRFIHPLWYAFLIFLLFNTNSHSVFIALSLTILFTWEFYRDNTPVPFGKLSTLIMLMGGVLSFLQLLPHSDSIDYSRMFGSIYVAPFIAIANAFYPWHLSFITHSQPRLIITSLATAVFFVIILSLHKKPAVLFVMLLSFSGLFYIFVFVYFYPGAIRHHGLIFIIFLFALWISKYYHYSHKKLPHIAPDRNLPKISIVIINICLALSLPYSLKMHYLEYKYLFSGSKEMAEFIKRNNLDTYTIVACPSPQASALLPYLPGKHFWYAGIEDYGTFVVYNTKFRDSTNISNSDVISRMEKTFSRQSKILLLLSRPLNDLESNGFRLLYKVDGVFGYNLERYYLYKSIQEEP
jgi:hypothetical protein